jgi:hypothetical protein
MQIDFKVVEVREVMVGDGRAANFADPTQARIVRLRPVKDECESTVGDVIVAMSADDAASLAAEVIAHDPNKNILITAVPGTKAMLTIG